MVSTFESNVTEVLKLLQRKDQEREGKKEKGWEEREGKKEKGREKKEIGLKVREFMKKDYHVTT